MRVLTWQVLFLSLIFFFFFHMKYFFHFLKQKQVHFIVSLRFDKWAVILYTYIKI